MKELSIEEKAKAYDEAIERVEDIKTGKCETRFMFTEGLFEHIFPALKESGDERTWIINYLSNRILNSTIIAEKENLKKAIAWLEKQGEQKHAWSEEDENIIEAIEALCDDKIRFTEFQDVKERAYTVKNWLKSLKDRVQPQSQSTWKPSDEQMEALVSAIDVMIDNRGAGDKNTILLSGLYHELKTL